MRRVTPVLRNDRSFFGPFPRPRLLTRRSAVGPQGQVRSLVDCSLQEPHWNAQVDIQDERSPRTSIGFMKIERMTRALPVGETAVSIVTSWKPIASIMSSQPRSDG